MIENSPYIDVEEAVIDETDDDSTVRPIQYQISSYGADIDAEGFVNRLKRDDVYIPPFQRDYVWTQKEASRFIESLLLGLPVPGVFLAKERDSKRLLVIDGQQRLKTLLFFLEGFFNPKEGDKRKKVFDLLGVQECFEGKTYETLSADERISLNDSIIHATIVKQDTPKGDDSSIYHIFERLNNSGRKLSPQQIRVAIYHGHAIKTLHKLNEIEQWREIFGARSKTLKDEELILRFFALYYHSDKYSRPMKDFLNTYLDSMKQQGELPMIERAKLFEQTIRFIHSTIGKSAFKPERGLNAAVFDSVMVGTARRLVNAGTPHLADYCSAYESLLKSPEFINLVSKSTADEANVLSRLRLATDAFAALPPCQ